MPYIYFFKCLFEKSSLKVMEKPFLSDILCSIGIQCNDYVETYTDLLPDFPYEDGDVPCDSKFFHDMDIYDCKQSGKCDYDSELTQGDVGIFVIGNYMKTHRKIFF